MAKLIKHAPVVVGTSGQYSDTSVWVAAVCLNTVDATLLAKQCNDWAKPLWLEHSFGGLYGLLESEEEEWAEHLKLCPDQAYIDGLNDIDWQPGSKPEWSVEDVLLWQPKGKS